MNSSQSGEYDDGVDQDNAKLLSHENRVKHLAAGYSNSQSVVRFLDTKATAVVGIVPIILGALAGITSWILGDADWLNYMWDAEWSNCYWVVHVLLVVGTLLLCIVTAVGAVWKAMHALSPRDNGKARPSILFPYIPYRKHSDGVGGTHPFLQRVDLFVSEVSQKDELDDYRSQLIRMGEIVAEKHSAVQHSICWLSRLLVGALTYCVLLAGLRILLYFTAGE